MEASLNIPIGIANSVSANFGYDVFDALKYEEQSNFDLIQIFLNSTHINDAIFLKKLKDYLLGSNDKPVYFHAEGFLNREFQRSEYSKKLFEFVSNFEHKKLIIHFDETEQLEEILDIISYFSDHEPILYLENYFRLSGKVNAEKNLRKYLALFTLANSQQFNLAPVIDIPRFFNASLKFTNDEALQWCFELFNYFGNRGIPILLHLMDATKPTQERNTYCTIGEGYIPFREIFQFMLKIKVPIEGIILEFEDKIHPLKSRDNLISFLSK